MARHKSKHSSGQGGGLARAAAGGSSAGPVPALAAAVAVLAVAAVYLNQDLLGLAPTTTTLSSAGSGSDGLARGGTDGVARGCDEEHRKASAHFRAGRVQHGLEELMLCAKKTPDSARAHWDVGVQLAKVKDYDNALSWLDQAMALNGTNVKYFSGAGMVATRAGQLARAKGYFERCMEVLLRLHAGSWVSTLLNSVSEHEADMVWIVDESPDALDRLQHLLNIYLRLQENVNANAAFKVLTKLQPRRHDLHRQYSEFLTGQGLLLDSTAVIMEDLRQIITEKYSVHTDSYGFANLHGLLYLGGSLDSAAVTVARQLLLTGDDAHLSTMRVNCKLDEAGITVRAGAVSVPAALARGVVARCLDVQGVAARLLDTGASTDVKNGFNYAPLHYAATFGSATFLKAAIDAKPLLEAATSLGHTAVHLAAVRGHAHLLPQLYLAGVPKEAKDRRGRTVLDIACLHRYAAGNVTNQFGKAASEVCTKEQLTPATAPAAKRSLAATGWRKPTTPVMAGATDDGDGACGGPPPPACDFDVRQGLTTERFLFDYLALQRPVLVRGATSGPRWDGLRAAWARKRLVKDHGDVALRVGAVPYAEAFGLNSSEMALGDFVKYMDRVHKKGRAKADHRRPPEYAFESLPTDHPLTRDMQLPAVLNPAETEIIPHSVQFYLGPAGSGAPAHVHRSAYNVQVAGRKKWALLPPPHALYSKEPAALFFAERVGELRRGGAVVMECVQEAGDMLFVPGAWAHATLNLEESVGYASEFVWGGDEFSVSEELLEEEEAQGGGGGGGGDDGSVGQGLSDDDEKPRSVSK